MLELILSLGLIIAPVALTKGNGMPETRLAKVITIAVMLALGIMIGYAWS